MAAGYNIPFNKPYLSGKELEYIREAVDNGHLSGNGFFTKKCQAFFENRYGFGKCLLTTSCTDALEMAAILCRVEPGDEVIMPSFTFVSTANAFVLRGAKIVFCDSRSDHPGMDEDLIEGLITLRTKVIVPVHYAGVACDMDKIMGLAKKYDLLVVEDAAQAIDSFYTGPDGIKRPLGGIGHLGAFSFHETKNIQCGEGGMLVINDMQFAERAEIIWEKGTNRAAFFRGDIDKYGWVDVGSSFLPSELNAAYLWAQLENLDSIQNQRKQIWRRYYELLHDEEHSEYQLPVASQAANHNGHMFYILTKDLEQRSALISRLRSKAIMAVFHYQNLEFSRFYHSQTTLLCFESLRYSNTLLRLPLFINVDVDLVVQGLAHD